MPRRKLNNVYTQTGALFVVLILLSASVIWIALGTAKPTNEPTSTVSTEPPSSQIAAVNCDVSGSDLVVDTQEQEMANLINQYRQQNGLPALTLSGILNQTAAWTANDFSAVGGLNTDHIDSLGRNWEGRLRDCGYSAFGVDILANNADPSPASTLNLWKNSPHHNMVILSQVADINGGAPHQKNWTAMGVARKFNGTYWFWVVDFGESNDCSTPPTDGGNNPPQPPTGGSGCIPGTICDNTDIDGNWYYVYPNDDMPGQFGSADVPPNAADCQFACNADSNCQSWVYVPAGSPGALADKNRCYEKSTANFPVKSVSNVSAGYKQVLAVSNLTCSGATLSWRGSAPGWWVDVSQDSTFAGYWNKQVANVSSTNVPQGFSGGLSLTPGVWYFRVYYGADGQYSPLRQFTVPSCNGNGGGGGGGNTNVTVNVTTNKTTYVVGEKGTFTYTITPKVATYIKIIDKDPTGTQTVLGEGLDDGNGDTIEMTITPPTGQECIIVQALTGQGGTVKNQAQACFTVTASNPTVTPTSTPTKTPTPVPPTATATPRPNTPTNTPVPGQPTSTPVPSGQGQTALRFQLDLPGIGTNTNIGENNTPVRSSIPVSIQIFDSQNNKVKDQSGNLSYVNISPGVFAGNINVDGLTNGTYAIKVKINNSLWKRLDAQNIIQNTENRIRPDFITLVTGDINQDNIIDLLDYNILVSCYGAKSCSDKTTSDLNIDGKVDEKDLNIILTALSNRTGD